MRRCSGTPPPVTPPPSVTSVADALTGAGQDGDLDAALGRLLAVGDTSGTALAHGLLRAGMIAA